MNFNQQYLHCDRCKFFISRNSTCDHHGLCPGCSERMKPVKNYDMDELESRRYLFGECLKCDSIYIKRKTEKCLLCRNVKLRRVR